jgi:hypothetical protein
MFIHESALSGMEGADFLFCGDKIRFESIQMTSNPFLGVFFHWLGGLASGSFYVPYRGVRKWAWEVYWLVGGFFSWIIAPWVLASINTNDLLTVLREAPTESLLWAYFWGAMWGLGGLTFGLTMRYLGLSLGMAVALGYCAIGPGHSCWRRSLSARHRHSRHGRAIQGEGNDG